jgi:hypothetical protein
MSERDPQTTAGQRLFARWSFEMPRLSKAALEQFRDEIVDVEHEAREVALADEDRIYHGGATPLRSRR